MHTNIYAYIHTYLHIYIHTLFMCVGTGIRCDFERENICGYHVTADDSQFKWLRNRGPTFSGNTGPYSDVTYGNTTGKSCRGNSPLFIK